MRILMIGDIVGDAGCNHLRKVLPSFKRQHNIDLVIANGENSAPRNGIIPKSAEHIFTSGVDVITTGNHALRRKECNDYFETCPYLIRPANFADSAYGKGVCIVDKGFIQVCVINLQGLVYLDKIKSPFDCLDDILKKYSHCRIKLIYFHAEDTAEKKALGYYADGRITALVGTHTHIPTSDAQILPQNTAYITDLGMTGPIESVLGVKKEQSIAWLKGTVEHQHFETADGPCEMDCVIIEADNKTGNAISIKQYIIK